MIPSPKDRFLADAALSKTHSDTVSSTPFAVALDAALLEYGKRCSKEKQPEVGGTLLRGAYEFAEVFCNLSEPRKQSTVYDPDNL